MLLSMTGFGESHRHADGLTISVEIRTVNNRYFKLSSKLPEGYASLEPEIESLVRTRIKRGTVQVNLRIDRVHAPDDFRLNEVAIASYREQLEDLYDRWKLPAPVNLEHLLLLPGVVQEENVGPSDLEKEWPLIRESLAEALEKVSLMRQEEGRAMVRDLLANIEHIAEELKKIHHRLPQVAEDYRKRMEERVNAILAEYEISVGPADLIREISIFSERVDISEEIVRLQSHLKQFEKTTQSRETSGRKLDFLTQEMFRETNTIGSKANDVEIAAHVVEIKATIEKIREMVQNLE